MLKDILIRRTIPAWLMLILGLLGTVFVSLQVKQVINEDAKNQFAFNSDQVAQKISERLGAYALILRGSAAYIAGSKNVKRLEWQDYVETLRAQDSIPGMQGIGFSQIIPPNQLTQHIDRVRNGGFPEYTVWPSGKRHIYSSILYLEPFNDRNLRAFGYDMLSEPVRRAAMEQARDTGKATLSGKVTLAQKTSTNVPAEALMYMPIYRKNMPIDTVEQRRIAFTGWVYSPYRMDDLMRGILQDWAGRERKGLVLHIYDGSQEAPATLLFNSDPALANDPDSLFYQKRTINFNGRPWLLVFNSTPSTSGVEYDNVWLTLIGGLAISILLFGLVISVINTRSNATRIASKLDEEEGKFRALFQMSPIGVAYHEMLYDTSGRAIDYRFLDANQSYLELTGVDPRGKTVRQVFPGIENNSFDWIGAYDHITRMGGTVRLEQRLQSNNRWYECVAYPYKSGQFVVAFLEITKRKQAEDALRDSEARFSTIFAGNSVAMLLVDPSNGHIVDANLQAATFYGWDVTTLRSMNICDINTLDYVSLLPKMHLALKSEKKQFFFQHRRANGDVCDVETFTGPVTIDGKTYVLSSVHDITERKKTELALRDSEASYSVLFEQNIAAMLLIDVTDGRIVNANRQACDFYGWDADTLRAMNIRDLNTLGSNQLLSELGRALHFNKRRLFFQHRRANGELRDVEFFSGPVVLGGKSLLLSSITDITDRKKTELALRNSESFNEAVLNSLVEHIAVLDSHGVIVSVNNAWLEFAKENGAPVLPEQWIGINYIDICGTSPSKLDNSEGALAQSGIQAVLSGEKTDFEMEYACHSPEEPRWFIMHVNPLKGSSQGVVVAHENITLRKMSEIEIYSSHSRLEELTLQLIDAQEQERKNIARELHDELGQRFATLKMNLHHMRQYLDDTGAESTWQKASDDVTAMIAQMRSISGALRPPMLDYLGLEVSVNQLLQQHFSNSPITYVLEYAGLPNKISEQIEITVYRIIQESITNIVRHANASHVIVEVNGGENASDIEIIIRDNGIGFDPAHVDFSQRRSFGLIGMGERVKLLNGELHVSSEIGNGTRITAWLPLKND